MRPGDLPAEAEKVPRQSAGGRRGGQRMKVSLIGTGCGPGTRTAEAAAAIREAGLLIGSPRLMEQLPPHTAECVAEYRPEAIAEILSRSGVQRAAVLLSGDSGFFSGAAGLLPVLERIGAQTEILPGISSLQVLAARLGRPWQEWRLCSAHGAACDPVFEVMQGRPVLFLTSGAAGLRELCRRLTEAGLSELPVTVGENLGQPGEMPAAVGENPGQPGEMLSAAGEHRKRQEAPAVSAGENPGSAARERIVRTTAGEAAEGGWAPLNVLLAEPAPRYPAGVPGIPDEEFLREKVPMTKQEVRAAALAKLGVRPDDVCWDIGAGTGSVSVELALHSRAVWAVERDPEALALAEKNRRKFGAWNLHLIAGEAPEALAGLPAPDAVFIGGSGGRLPEILRAVKMAAPGARIVVTAISLETLRDAAEVMRELGAEPEISQISVSRSRKAGELHLLLAQNPVFLICGRGTQG